MSDLFFRIFQHLLPDARAWRPRAADTVWTIGDEHTIGEPGLFIGGLFGTGLQLWRFFRGLADALAAPKDFFDSVYLDLFPDTTRELPTWEDQFGIVPGTQTETDRRLGLEAAWQATGGQSPSYLQGVLRAAGFDVYVHEWWSSGPPYVARDPRTYTEQPLVGTFQCSALPTQPQCNRFLANETFYLVNKDLTSQAPPAVPDSAEHWPYFTYVGAETFPNHATVPSSRREEFERMLLKHFPTHQWLVVLVDYSSS